MTSITTAWGGIRQNRRLMPLLFYAAFLLFHLYTQWGRVQDVAVPNEYDELQHVSYTVQMRTAPALFPDYAALRLIDLDDPRRFTNDRSYLNHPSAYYLLLAPFAGGDQAVPLFQRLRLVNLVLSTLALVILFRVGFVALHEPRGRLIFALVGVLCPLVAGLGAQVNNDNAAFLGAAIALLGLFRLAEGRTGWRVAALIGGGFAVAALAKLTAGLLVGIAVVTLHWRCRGALRRAAALRSLYGAILVGALLLGLLPYLHNLAVYHAPLYVDRTLLPTADLRLGLGSFLAWFSYALAATWSIYPPADALQILTLAAILGTAASGFARPASSDGAARAVVGACGVAVLVVLPIHFFFSYSLHLEIGHHGGVHIRYYLPMWGGAMLGAALGVGGIRAEAGRAAATLVLTLMLIYSNLASAAPDGLDTLVALLCRPIFGCGAE